MAWDSSGAARTPPLTERATRARVDGSHWGNAAARRGAYTGIDGRSNSCRRHFLSPLEFERSQLALTVSPTTTCKAPYSVPIVNPNASRWRRAVQDWNDDCSTASDRESACLTGHR